MIKVNVKKINEDGDNIVSASMFMHAYHVQNNFVVTI
jgi:hypothetical protein